MLQQREQNTIGIYDLVHRLNRSALRKSSIPQELVSGWPCIHRMGNTLCATIPYFARRQEKQQILLYPLYCSVTVAINNPDRIMDLTVYPFHKEWEDLDYTKPVGQFPHPILGQGIRRQEYQAMCMQLYELYDQMVTAIQQQRPFAAEQEMIDLFSRLMEPGQYPQYLRVNQKFYSYFCQPDRMGGQ